MELATLTPDLPQLLVEMGVKYDPERLAAVYASQPVDLAARAAVVATKLGGFTTLVRLGCTQLLPHLLAFFGRIVKLWAIGTLGCAHSARSTVNAPKLGASSYWCRPLCN